MKRSGDQKQGQKKVSEIKTFTVPLALGENKENITAKTNTPTKEQIINQAFKFHSQGNISEAAKYYQYFINQGFKDHIVFSNYGAVLQNIGKLKEAESSYRKAIEIKPGFADAHSNLGNILRELGKLPEAEIMVRKAIKLKPDFANAHCNLGTILKDLGNLKEAALFTQKAIEIDPNFTKAHYSLGVILREQGKLKEAELSTRKAIKIKPNFANAHYTLGVILRDLGNLKEAELSTRKAIKINPNYANTHYSLGVILKDLGNLKEAELSTRKAIEVNPNYAEAYYNIGVVLKDQGKLKEAELSTRKAIEINPNYAKAYSNLGNILEELGKREEAIKQWVRAVNLNPKLDESVISLALHLCLERKYELAVKYLSKNNSIYCQSLYLGCLLSLDREKEFNKKYQELSQQKLCNAAIGGIVEHANVIYKKSYGSPFCNEAVKYVFIDKINEESFSENHLKELISYAKNGQVKSRNQGILHGGVQTSGDLFSLNLPFVKVIKKALEEKIELYKNHFKDSGQGFIENWPRDYQLRSWMICMKDGGFLSSHNHEYGWITGSFYLQVPKSYDNEEAGSIAFSYQGPKYPSKDKNFNLTIKKIETRDICIFPSSLFHHTIPFKSTEERICFVFDLVQK